jgi:hypothetical protein
MQSRITGIMELTSKAFSCGQRLGFNLGLFVIEHVKFVGSNSAFTHPVVDAHFSAHAVTEPAFATLSYLCKSWVLGFAMLSVYLHSEKYK